MNTYLQGPGWRYSDAFAIFLAMIGGAFVGAVAMIFFVEGEASGTEQLLFLAGGQFVGALAFIVLYSRRKGTGNLTTDYGLTFRFEDIWAFFLGIGASLVLGLASTFVFDQLGVEADEQGVADLVRDSPGVAGTVVVVLIVGIAAPFVEEILFRGVLLAALTRAFSRRGAIVISAGVFAVTHLTDPDAVFAVPALFGLGLIFGSLALRGGDLSRPILAHMGVNSLAIAQILLT